jgi:hypothetical protein
MLYWVLGVQCYGNFIFYEILSYTTNIDISDCGIGCVGAIL